MSHYRFEDASPQIGTEVFIAPSAEVIGDVTLGDTSSIWYQCVLRGDVFPITIGARTNFQDLSLGHVTGGQHALNIGDDVTIGHRVIVHGCTIGNSCLIGMGAIILDGAIIEDHCLIGAGSVITPRTRIPKGSLVMGTPGRVIRPLTETEITAIKQSAEHYVRLAQRHHNSTTRL